jgi:23S rRNA (cytidine1920-2'-O)/16S rRNA (cytidine1409-2'-O)-methyltransferase
MTASTDTRPTAADAPPKGRAAKRRLDDLLVERELAPDRDRARALVLARKVLVRGQVALRAAEPLPTDTTIELKQTAPYVSRGGEKLAHALKRAGIEVS